MNSKLELRLDFDGVFADSGAVKSLVARELFNIDVDPANFKKETVVGKIKKPSGNIFTLDNYRAVQHFVNYDVGYGMRITPIGTIEKHLPLILNQGHKIRVVTSRDGLAAHIASLWTKEMGVDIPLDSVGYGNPKDKFCVEAHLYADDDHPKLESVDVGFKSKDLAVPKLVLVGHDYNQDVDSRIATRIEHSVFWEWLYDHVREVSRQL